MRARSLNKRSISKNVPDRNPSVLLHANTRLVGVAAFFSLFRGFKFFPLPSRVAARPLAGNANRWALVIFNSIKGKK